MRHDPVVGEVGAGADVEPLDDDGAVEPGRIGRAVTTMRVVYGAVPVAPA